MKILIWDIETLPLVVTSWSLFDLHLGIDNILQDTSLICGAWKWVGEDEVHSVSVDPKDPTNDKKVCEALHKVLSEADVIVAHNGDDFDLRVARGRFLKNGLPPLKSLRTVDTKKVAKKLFRFTSNKLDYLGKFLGLGAKLPTGNGLWLGALKGDKKSITDMVTYNKQDVQLLEKVYLTLRPHMDNHPNHNLHKTTPDGRPVCPVCGEDQLKKWGHKFYRTSKKQQYRCGACKAYSYGKSVELVEVR